MRTITTVFVIAVFLCSADLFSQVTGDYESNGIGKWDAASTWQTYNGSAWVTATTVPTGSENITIRVGDSVDVDIPITITGYIKSLGGKLGNSSTNLTFGDKGIFEWATNGGSLPVATWGTGSTILFTGIIDTASSNSNQNFYNVTWKCPNYKTAINLAWIGNTIGGTLKVYGSLVKTMLRLTSPTVGNKQAGPTIITINGDVIVEDNLAYLSANGSSTGDTMEIYVKGNITSYGTLNLCNGSAGMCKWFLSGNLNIIGGAITTNSNVTTLPDSLIFNGTTKQLFFKADSLGSASNIQFTLRPGAIVDLDSTSIGGTATSFTQPSGTTLITAHKNGLKGNLSMQGKITLPVDGNYEYDGTVAQSDSLLPAAVNKLTINNPTTVTLVKPITINDTLRLKQGILDNSINAITIGATGAVVFEGGNTAVPIPGWPNGIKDIAPAPRVFKLFNNYPNPFNPSTQIRFSVPKDGYTTLKVLNILGQEVTTLFEGTVKAGNLLEVSFDARRLSSGIYFARLQQDGRVSIQKMNLIK